MSITQLQKQIKEREDKIAAIEQSKAGFEQQFSALGTEEHGLIVAARTGDEAAKARLAQIRQDKKTAEREIRDDASAIAEITRELDPLRAVLAEEQRENKRKKLLEEVALFSKRAEESLKRIRAAAAELRQFGDTARAEADELRKLLIDTNIETNNVTGIAIQLSAALTHAADILEPNRRAIGYHCAMHVQRFISALGHVALTIEHKSEAVSA